MVLVFEPPNLVAVKYPPANVQSAALRGGSTFASIREIAKVGQSLLF